MRNQTAISKKAGRSLSNILSRGKKPRPCTIGEKRSSRRVSPIERARNWTRRSRFTATMALGRAGSIGSKPTAAARNRHLQTRRRGSKTHLPQNHHYHRLARMFRERSIWKQLFVTKVIVGLSPSRARL